MKGRCEEAIRYFEVCQSELPRHRALANLGQAFLFSGQLDKAVPILDEWAGLRQPRMEYAYILSGTVRWLRDEIKEACRIWTDGLDCDYRDASGGVSVALLLYFASVVFPDCQSSNKAAKLLKKSLKSHRATNWPGQVAHFLLGQLSKDDLFHSARHADNELDLNKRVGCAEFYSGVHFHTKKKRADLNGSLCRSLNMDSSKYTVEGLLAQCELNRFEMRMS